MADPIELPHITGQVPWSVEQAILRLREAIDLHGQQLEGFKEQLGAMPTPLTLPEIQQALSPSGDYPLPTAGLLNTTPAPTVPGDTAPPTPVNDGLDTPPLPTDFLTIVQEQATARAITGASTDEEVFNFMRGVVDQINTTITLPSGLVLGFTDAPPGGSNVYTCLGLTYRYARVTFSNDHTFKILIDADPGGARTPEWADEGIITGLYRVATAPDTGC